MLAGAAALRQSSSPEIAALFVRTRLAARHGATYGTSALSPDEARAVLERALPFA
jgi:hypothetical protein